MSPVAVVGLLVEEGPQLADAPVDLALDHRVARPAATAGAVLDRPPPRGRGGGGGHAGGHALRRLKLPAGRRGSHLKSHFNV